MEHLINIIRRACVRKLFLGIAVTALLAVGGAASAAKPPPAPAFVGPPPTLVNTSTADLQIVQAIGAPADGGYTVAWFSQDEPVPGPDTELFIQRYSANGLKLGAETQIPFSSEDMPAVGVLPDGHVVVVYSATRPAPGMGSSFVTLGLFTQRFDAGGTPVGGETEVFSIVHDGAGSLLRRFDDLGILTWGDGSRLVGWAVRSGTDPAQLVPTFQTRRYGPDGNPLGAFITVRDIVGAEPLTHFRLTAANDGGYLVSQSLSIRGINLRYLRFDDTQVEVAAFGDIGTGNIGIVPEGSVLVPLDDGGYVLWSFFALGAFKYYALLDSNFNFVGPQIPIDTLPFGQQVFLPESAAVLGDGSFVTIWRIVAPDGSQRLLVQQFDGTAQLLGNALSISPVGDLGFLPPVVTSLTDGGFALAWNASRPGTSGPGIPGDVDVYTTSFHPPESDGKANKAKQAQSKLCKAQAKGLKGQEHKRFIDQCLQN